MSIIALIPVISLKNEEFSNRDMLMLGNSPLVYHTIKEKVPKLQELAKKIKGVERAIESL